MRGRTQTGTEHTPNEWRELLCDLRVSVVNILGYRRLTGMQASRSNALIWGIATLFSLAWAVLVVSFAGLPF